LRVDVQAAARRAHRGGALAMGSAPRRRRVSCNGGVVMNEINLFDRSHEEASRLVGAGVPVYLTINPVEYHGPHLSLHNDKLVSRGLVRDLHRRLAAHHPEWPLLLGSDLEVGVEPCPGIGSRHTPYLAARDLVV